MRRRRAVSLTLTIALHALILFLLLHYVATQKDAAKGTSTVVVNIQPETRAPNPEKANPQVVRARAAPAAAARKAEATKPPPPPLVQAPQASVKLDIVQLSHEDFVGGDISKLPSHNTEMASAAQGTGEGPAEKLAGPGEGSGGTELFAADWQRRPTNAELQTYVKPGAPEGYGLIACKTEPGFRVDDCKTISEEPAGSGLARSVLNAAWQFRVLPPRINGKPQIGAWVKIEITYSHSVVSLD